MRSSPEPVPGESEMDADGFWAGSIPPMAPAFGLRHMRELRGPGGGAGLDHRRDLLGRVPGLGEGLLGVLAEGGRRPGRVPRRAAELDRDSKLADGPEVRLLHLDDHLAGPDELRVERLVEVEDRLDAAVVLV